MERSTQKQEWASIRNRAKLRREAGRRSPLLAGSRRGVELGSKISNGRWAGSLEALINHIKRSITESLFWIALT
jgi:hypothetical protein